MSFADIALKMFPYWIMGIFMLCAVYRSKYKDLLRVEWKPILKWTLFLCGLTIYRSLMFKYFYDTIKLHDASSGAMIIPWQMTLTVFWEDACHGLPLAIFSLYLGQDKIWKKILTWATVVLFMVSFGLGHVYQGYTAAIFLSFYIPYTFKKGQEIGFGTIMICHTLYDLVTILTLKMFLG